MTTLYIRLAPRSEGEAASVRFALLADSGALVRQGEGALRAMGDVIGASRRVVLLVAAADVTLLQVRVPPLSAARLKTALPSLVEEQILGDPSECVLVAAPAQSADGMRAIAVVQRAWLEPLVRAVLALGARGVGAVPAQLCLPLQPGQVSGAIGRFDITLRHGLYQGLGLGLAGPPGVALQTARALAGDAPLTLYVPSEQLGEYQALVSEAGPAVTLEADQWPVWVAGARTCALDLVPGLGAAGAKPRDWRRWRWPLRLALLALVVNLIGLNVQWLRLKREADATRQAMLQTFRSAYPKESVILDPAAQMRKNLASARANTGQVGADEFTYLAAAFGEAARALGRPLSIISLDYRERALTVKVKPESADPGLTSQIKTALAARNLSLAEAAPATWLIRNTGVKQ